MSGVGTEELLALQKLYDDGLFVQAWRRASTFGAVEAWSGTHARVLGARLLGRVGAPRRARRLFERAWREDPADPEARYFHACELTCARGPLSAWRWLAREPELETEDAELRGAWCALHAELLSDLRDFRRAHEWSLRAREAAPRSAWCLTTHARVLAREDRRQEGLEWTEAALRERPHYRPAAGVRADLLADLDRLEEALALLRETDAHVECAAIAWQRGTLAFEAERYPEAQACWERYAALSPALEPALRRLLEARRSDVCYKLGDVAGAVRHARRTRLPFFAVLAKRLEAAGEARARVLPVPFVRQLESTCVPATLAALGAFWGRPVEQRAVVEAICYDGTPSHLQRSWLESQGFFVREFRLDWESACAAVDAGIPFALTTQSITSSHMVAVVGYDARRGTLLLHDPSERCRMEAEATGLIECQASSGPRALAFVPEAERARLEALALPEAALFERLHRLEAALARADRPAAAAALAELEREAPEATPTLHARVLLASHEGDLARRLEGLAALTARFPKDARLRYQQIGARREVTSPELHRLLQECASGPLAGPAFWQQLGDALCCDARGHRLAQRLLEKAIAGSPEDGAGYHILGDLRAAQGAVEEAWELLRFGSCLSPRNEHYAFAYFDACRAAGRAGEGIAFLEERAARFAAKSSAPVRTLFDALDVLGRTDQGLALLEEALARDPEDGELLLSAAVHFHRCPERRERAAALLEGARGRVPEGAWLRAAGGLARVQGRWGDALALWRRLLAAEPAAPDVHRELAWALDQVEGRDSALAHVRARAAAAPREVRPLQLLADWLRGEDSAEEEECLRALVALDPADAWAQRELAHLLVRQKRYQEAQAPLDAAAAIAPRDALVPALRGRLLLELGQPERAAESLRAAVRLSVEEPSALGLLLRGDQPTEARREALAFVRARLKEQPLCGDAILAYAEAARGVVGEEELLADLLALRRERPEAWQPLVARVRLEAELGRLDAAWEGAREATRWLPLRAFLWLEQARVARARRQDEAERAALERALELAPSWPDAVQALAGFFARREEWDAQCAVLEAGLSRDPANATHHALLAEPLTRTGRFEEAMGHLEEAVRRDPRYEWAWIRLGELCAERGCASRAVDRARGLTERRPNEPFAWRIFAEVLRACGRSEEWLKALDEAVRLAPRDVGANDARVVALVELHRFEEAAAACRPAAFGEGLPLELQGRALWVQAASGELVRAADGMEELLRERPDYAFGWGNLAEWAESLGRAGLLERAARELVRLQPDSPISYGYLGQAELAAGRRAEAKAAFDRALTLAPDYGFAAFAAFDLALQDGELESAHTSLELLRRHAPGPFTEARRVKWLAHGSLRHALESFGPLCRMEAEVDWPVRAAYQALREGGAVAEARAILEEALGDERACPWAGAVWADAEAREGRWARACGVACGLSARTKAARRAVESLLEHLTAARQLGEAGRLLRHQAAWFREDSHLWSSAGRLLVAVGLDREAAGWMADWRERPGLEPALLAPLVEALHGLGRHEEAFAVLRQAPQGEGYAPRVEAAFAAALLPDGGAGADAPGAVPAEALEGFPLAELETEQRFALHLARALGEARRPGWTAGALLERMETALLLVPSPRMGQRRLYALAARRIAESTRCWRLVLWARLAGLRAAVAGLARRSRALAVAPRVAAALPIARPR